MAFATLTVDCDTISQNIQAIRAGLSASTRVMIIVKADAYGLGAVAVATHIAGMVDYFGVATISEALDLRDQGIQTPILLLSEPLIADIPIAVAHDIDITLYHPSTIAAVNDYVQGRKHGIRTHLKVDTGMCRLGVPWDATDAVIAQWHATNHRVEKVGMYSHYANSDQPAHPLNAEQLARFLPIANDSSIIYHFSNSDAVKHFHHFGMVRVGWAAYKNSVTLTAPVRAVRDIPSGTSVGYGSTFVSRKPMRMAVVGMGYADGLSTHLSNNGYFRIGEYTCPIIGRVCMDMVMVALPEGADVGVGDVAVILSPDDEPGMNVVDVAEATGENPREVLCRLSARVMREYLGRRYDL
jgi:alanine racemase